MFEDKTYEALMEDALDDVTNDVDKREGSVIYDALGPCIYQIAQMYFQLNNFIDLVMLDTAVGTYLDRKAAEFAVTRKAATFAVRSVVTDAAIPLGSRWAISGINYTITKVVSTTSYEATCETAGAVGNTYEGALTKFDVSITAGATLTNIVTSGADAETDEALRARVYEAVRKPSASGNSSDYKGWAMSIEGVTDAKVFPLADGAGTVKVLIVGANKDIDASLEDDVAEYIEAHRPVGATVTVDSPTAKEISVSATLSLTAGTSLTDVTTSFTTKLTSYLRGLTFNTYSVSYARIGALLLTIDGVNDYTDLLVNAGTESISIDTYETATVGTITLT